MDEDLIEHKLDSEKVYDGVLLHVRKDKVRLPNESIAYREWVKHPGASAVLPILPDGKLIFVRQYRYPVGEVTLEIPAGKLDSPDEDPLDCAVRELSEETGYSAEHIDKLATIATTVGFSDEKIHIYAANGMTRGKSHPDDDEFINTVLISMNDALDMIGDGRIYDAKSVVAVLMAARRGICG